MSIPNGPDDLTWSWFEEVTDWSVDDVRIERIGIDIGSTGAVYRAHLGGTACPSTAIVKLAAVDPDTAGTATVLGLYRREVAFYRELASVCPIRIPTCFHHDIDGSGARFVIVMEDLGDHRTIDQVAGVGLADAERIVERLADWHATWWGRTDPLTARGLAVPIGSPMYPANLPALFAQGWAKLVAEAPHVTDGLEEVARLYPSSVEPTLRLLDEEPVTLLHGDFRADNMFVDSDGDLMLIDFQVMGTGAPVYDLAYFVTQSLDARIAAANERDLFERWRNRLLEHRPSAHLDGEWERYRLSTIFCVTYPVVAARGMDLSDLRQRALVETMMKRIRRACDELDLVPLWR